MLKKVYPRKRGSYTHLEEHASRSIASTGVIFYRCKGEFRYTGILIVYLTLVFTLMRILKSELPDNVRAGRVGDIATAAISDRHFAKYRE